MAWAKGQDTDGRSLLSQVRGSLGNLSTPWLLIPFVGGGLSRQLRVGAPVGLLATVSALSGFYLFSTLVEDLGGYGFLADLRIELRANLVYFEFGLVTGPLLGGLGAWWKRSRRSHALLVAGALLMAEPLVLFAISSLRAHRLLPPPERMPVHLRTLLYWSTSGAVPTIVYLGELVVGLAVLVVAARPSLRPWRGRR